MNKVKSPFVKVLRKAGYSNKEAMNITLDAQYSYFHQAVGGTIRGFNQLAVACAVAAMFDWSRTDKGYSYWSEIWIKLGGEVI